MEVFRGKLGRLVPIFGSATPVYILIGAAFTAAGLITLAGGAGKWITFLPPDEIFVLGGMLMVIGTVIQDVVADAMSTEVVARVDTGGTPRPEEEVRADLGMVQVLGRLRSRPAFSRPPGPPAWLAAMFVAERRVPAGIDRPRSRSPALADPIETAERRPIDWRILGGGLAFGAVVLGLALGNVPFAQEIIFVLSMAVICGMLILVTRELDRPTRHDHPVAAIIIFVFRATPLVGDGYFWWTLDVLKFDEAFYGILRQIGAVVGLVALWLFSKQVTEYPIAKTLFWITIAGTILSLPNIGLFYGLHHWTEEHLGFGARAIALLDTATSSPLAQLSMVPLLTLIAYYAPAGQRATWFALMASLMNLAFVAGQLQTRYLNEVLTVSRGDYGGELGLLLIAVTVIGLGAARGHRDIRPACVNAGAANPEVRIKGAAKVCELRNRDTSAACHSAAKWPILGWFARSGPCPRMSRSARRR